MRWLWVLKDLLFIQSFSKCLHPWAIIIKEYTCVKSVLGLIFVFNFDQEKPVLCSWSLTLWLRRAAHSGSRKVYFRTASRCHRLAVNTTFQASYWCIATQWMVLANGVPSERLPHNKLALIMSDGALQTVQYNRSMCIGIARSVDSQQRWRTQEVHM